MTELTRTWITLGIPPSPPSWERVGVRGQWRAGGGHPHPQCGRGEESVGLTNQLQLAVLVREVVHRRVDALAAVVPFDMTGRAVIVFDHFGQGLLDRGRIVADGKH